MKKKIIIFSIIGGMVILLAVLFGAVFCLRNQVVDVVGERRFNLSDKEIVSFAQLGQGGSIFAVDKDGAINRIEQADPYIKVIQIKTKSPITIEIRVRARFETYYSANNNQFYIFDEELKLLNIVDTEPFNLIKIDEEYINFENLNICDFASGKITSKLTYNTFNAFYKYGKNDMGEYMTREQICEFIKSLTLDDGATESENYDRLIITTKLGLKFDIAKPEADLDRKINICLSSLNSLTDAQKLNGRIKITYLANGNEHIGYQET